MDAFLWKGAASALELKVSPLIGAADKAMHSYRSKLTNAYPRAIWISDFGLQTPSLFWFAAHELGHALGDMGHTVEEYMIGVGGQKAPQPPDSSKTGFASGSDNCQRLMTGLDGLRRNGEPKQLNKAERDWIKNFFQ